MTIFSNVSILSYKALRKTSSRWRGNREDSLG
ncbi:MAG: hypothetical protein GX836_05960 [Spirochaetales bacterium]|nr:hypothetical protein [Spirochaetales bacterium]